MGSVQHEEINSAIWCCEQPRLRVVGVAEVRDRSVESEDGVGSYVKGDVPTAGELDVEGCLLVVVCGWNRNGARCNPERVFVINSLTCALILVLHKVPCIN